MNHMSPQMTVCTNLPFEIAESPLWDDRRSLLWFVDINNHAIHSYDPKSGVLNRYQMPALVGSIGLSEDERLVAALKTGIHLFDPATGELEFIVNPEVDRPGNQLNDGKVGPDGCFWVGSMDENSMNISGALYRVTASGEVTLVKDGIFISNGLAWSPDGKIMYHSDGLSSTVKAFDFDVATGTISNERDFFTFDHEEFGWPDGATMDVHGNYWSAGIFRGKINQVSPEGKLLRSLQMPVLATTMPCLGGDDVPTLFVTSLASDVDDVRQEGALLSCEIDVAGVPSYRFSVADLTLS
ncbi:calcium-binding protein [Pseudomonas sp. 2822-15]|uniref:SMP-30/gluconolactonase/LRE family protein n=1 Tax=Pseudomonas sp. 2822-15 TaxID=1712677 RepID=UPI000C479E61|nr:SMP-30/gluconolactonase/LRE family protein [Pseudomonas sp. 2822-15]PIB42028.1 calcium-binding protein [Pseudomonas sp. 2822-15]